MSNYYNGLVQTTTATEIDCSKFESISSVSVDADVPENTSLHFVFQLNGGNWKKYSTTDKAWQDITGDVTADNIAEVGNTLAEVQALTSTELTSFVGKTVNFAVALTMDTSQMNVPTLRGVKFVGTCPKTYLPGVHTRSVKEMDGKTFQDGTATWRVEKYDTIFRQPSKEYADGDVVYIKGASVRYRLSCITAGTTSADELFIPLTVGTYVMDGTVRWIVEDGTQGDSVGDITLHPTLLAGHILADGATVKASEYPRLLAWVLDNAMTGDDDSHYTYNADADTLKLPNAIGRVLQGATSVATKAAGLPNITGDVHQSYNGSDWGGWHNNGNRGYGNGALYLSGASGHSAPGWGDYGAVGSIAIDASKSNKIYGASDTVQMPAITLLAQIKY